MGLMVVILTSCGTKNKFPAVDRLTNCYSKYSMKFMNEFRATRLRHIASEGGYSRIRLYGNPGTEEGRRKGGLNSLRTHHLRKTQFKQLTQIRRPRNSRLLAEFLGILIGDGHLATYWMSVTTNSKTDSEHAEFVQKMIYLLFGLRARIRKKKGQNALTVVVTAKNLVNFLHKKGMPKGNKLAGNLHIPLWITQNKNYKKSFLRGLFDTDGSVYQDFRVIKGRRYQGIGLLFSSASESLRKDIIEILLALDYNPTGGVGTHRSIYLRKRENIVRYFKEIGTSNLKHSERLERFLGGVA